MFLCLLALSYSIININIHWQLNDDTANHVFKSILNETLRFIMVNSIVGIIILINFYIILLVKWKKKWEKTRKICKFICIMMTALYFGISECSKHYINC